MSSSLPAKYKKYQYRSAFDEFGDALRFDEAPVRPVINHSCRFQVQFIDQHLLQGSVHYQDADAITTAYDKTLRLADASNDNKKNVDI